MNTNANSRKKILLSETPELLTVVRDSILHTSQISPLIASSTQEVMALARIWRPDLMVLGPLKDTQNITPILKTLKDSTDYRDIPLVAAVPQQESDLREEILASGCDEWISIPIDEMTLLTKIQDLVGIRFRKLPRYTHNAPALVSYRGKDFPSTSIDINRRMIFLECEEGLAPATGRNVQLQFQLTKKEPITCWGRVVRLMARKAPRRSNSDKEIIGMLIRFLDLPPSAANRIDSLSHQQRLSPAQGSESDDSVSRTFLDVGDYHQMLKKMATENSSQDPYPFCISQNILAAYIRSLSEEEQSCLREKTNENPNKILMVESIATRVKLMDDLTKIRQGASIESTQQSLKSADQMTQKIADQLFGLLEKNDKDEIIRWEKIKYEILRSQVEIKAFQKEKSGFSKVLNDKEHEIGKKDSNTKLVYLSILLMISILINFILLAR